MLRVYLMPPDVARRTFRGGSREEIVLSAMIAGLVLHLSIGSATEELLWVGALCMLLSSKAEEVDEGNRVCELSQCAREGGRW